MPEIGVKHVPHTSGRPNLVHVFIDSSNILINASRSGEYLFFEIFLFSFFLPDN